MRLTILIVSAGVATSLFLPNCAWAKQAKSEEAQVLEEANAELSSTEAVLNEAAPQPTAAETSPFVLQNLDSQSSPSEAQAEKVSDSENEMKQIEKVVDTKRILKQISSSVAGVQNQSPKTDRELTTNEKEAIQKELAHARQIKIDFDSAKKSRTPSSTKDSDIQTISEQSIDAAERHNERISQALEREVE